MIAALVIQGSTGQPLPQDIWAKLSYSVFIAHTSETIAVLRSETNTMMDDVTLRLTSRRHGEPPKIMWANGRTCPSASEAVKGLQFVPMPTPVFPGDPEDIILDGVGYRVRFRAHYGSEVAVPIELGSNTGTSLAHRVSKTFLKLKSCWSKTRPG